MRGRFFAEILRASMDVSGNSKESTITGKRGKYERRIVVNGEVAAVLCGLLAASSVILLAVLFLS